MTETNHPTPLDSGIAVIHSNKLEDLGGVVEYWLGEHPLAPLENEVFLVQSNGMGQWLQQSLAKNSALGISAANSMQLPALFIWGVYRAVLVKDNVPREQLLGKAFLTWRLYRLLPALITRPEFEILATFLAVDNNSRKRYQLAEQLADLFDQYQVYRSDWLADWASGLDSLRNAEGIPKAMPEAQRWQAALWRAVLADLDDATMPYASRASVHTLFMAHIDALEQRPVGIPRRIIVFGLSSLPQQSLEVLAKLGKFCQIVLFVHNPCQHYWADIIEDKELLKAERHRHAYKSGTTAALAEADLHLHSQPLLAAWGKQGRDYIRLLDQFDDTQAYRNWYWPDSKIDLFKDYCEPGAGSLLQQLQQTILDLEPLPATPVELSEVDDSLVFHVAHSPQREVEILHDQLLARFNATDGLHPRDVIVMVPDINKYAPHIRAVFGNMKPDDARFIPYSLADQQLRGQNPLLVAVETLLNLPDSRFTVSEFLGLLEVPALRQRFAIDEVAIPKLHQWLEEAGIRWGLNAAQRVQTVAMPELMEANTWQFGLRRMLLGYAVGAGEVFNGIEPYDEIGGLEAQWIGGLAYLLETLEKYANLLRHALSPNDWQRTLSALLADFFEVGSSEREQKTLETLDRALAEWRQICEKAGLTATDTLPLNVVREAWLGAVDEPNLQQRFLSGRVNFCTLMPMRAIPFRLICLLGMNDGDYPRSQPVHSFDLMSQRGQYRPGDRSRRQDDQYLFLEALLSSRQQLYISWVGRNIRDNSERPPSVLISQLRDTLALGWQLADNRTPLLKALTVEHPLQPFSTQYVIKNRDARLFTYAREWFERPALVALSGSTTATAYEKAFTLSLEALGRFLKAPVKTFCNNTLKFGFDQETVTSEDNEPFGFNRLESYVLGKSLLDALQSETPDNAAVFLEQQRTTMARQGKLPLGGFAHAAYADIADPVSQVWQRYQSLLVLWPTELEARVIDLSFALADNMTVQLTGELINLRHSSDGLLTGLIHITAQTLLTKTGKIKYHKLLLYWVQHLAACASGINVQTVVMGSDSVIEIAPQTQTEAFEQLKTVTQAWLVGMQAPLPIACKTAFSWLSAAPDKAREAAKIAYQGDDWTPGEVAYDVYLARFFPTFASLIQATVSGDFEAWTETLYRNALIQLKLQTAQDAQS
jgi:exodeoxyribonuclease V gamma subunit